MLLIHHASLERRRLRLAQAVTRLIDEAGEPRRRFSAAVPFDRGAVRALRTTLLDVVEDLSDVDRDVDERGIVLLEKLVRDGASPLYAPITTNELEEVVREARAALLR